MISTCCFAQIMILHWPRCECMTLSNMWYKNFVKGNLITINIYKKLRDIRFIAVFPRLIQIKEPLILICNNWKSVFLFFFVTASWIGSKTGIFGFLLRCLLYHILKEIKSCMLILVPNFYVFLIVITIFQHLKKSIISKYLTWIPYINLASN